MLDEKQVDGQIDFFELLKEGVTEGDEQTGSRADEYSPGVVMEDSLRSKECG
jgi:hypothetical protein